MLQGSTAQTLQSLDVQWGRLAAILHQYTIIIEIDLEHLKDWNLIPAVTPGVAHLTIC